MITITGFLEIPYRPVFLEKEGTKLSVFPNTLLRKQIQFPKRRVFCFLECRTMEKVQKPSNSVCNTPSSDPLRENMMFRLYNNAVPSAGMILWQWF
jgi:hypothetical protein